jgi:hypothetical protein
MAMLDTVAVFPSWGRELVKQIVLGELSACEKRIEVLTVR